VRRTVEREALFSRGDRVLVAVSGGPDSMALLHALALTRGKLGHALVAHGVDHGLRAEAASELDLAERFARSLDVPFDRTRVEVARGGNLQARARAARYEALRAAARRASASCIATAHHADDRAETVLLRLLRGAGPRGLAVLPPRSGDLVRPLIRAQKKDILSHLARHGVSFAEDPSNADPRFLRARVRSEILPSLARLSPAIVGHLCALADQLAEPPESGAYIASLGRATREALKMLAEKRSPRVRVPLPHGLVATYDEKDDAVLVAGTVQGPQKRRESTPSDAAAAR
jgi:tRNA(Ile)-lysidine synthase